MATGAGNLHKLPVSLHNDGFGTFEYGIDYTAAAGGSNPFFTPLTFTISDGPGLTLASFAELSTGGSPNAFFGLDIVSRDDRQYRTGRLLCRPANPVFSGARSNRRRWHPGLDRSVLRHVRAQLAASSQESWLGVTRWPATASPWRSLMPRSHAGVGSESPENLTS